MSTPHEHPTSSPVSPDRRSRKVLAGVAVAALRDLHELVVRGLPRFVLLDADGRVAFQCAGGIEKADEVAAMVEEHLGVRL